LIVTHFICDEYHAWVLMNLSNMTDFRQSNIIYKTNNNQFCFHFSLHLRFRNFVFMKTGSLFECRICWECRGAAQTRSGRPLFIVRPVPTPHEFITPPSACLKHHHATIFIYYWESSLMHSGKSTPDSSTRFEHMPLPAAGRRTNNLPMPHPYSATTLTPRRCKASKFIQTHYLCKILLWYNLSLNLSYSNTQCMFAASGKTGYWTKFAKFCK
jgi:hypothetical protein